MAKFKIKKIIVKKLILSLGVIVFSISCSSNDDDGVSTDSVVEIPVLPTKLLFSTDIPATIRYDGTKVTEISWVNSKFTFEYTGNLITRIIEYNGAGVKEMTTNFSYSSDKLVKTVSVESNSTKTTTYSYPDANSISFIETRNYTSAGTPQVDKDVTVLTLNNGNIVAEETTYSHNNSVAGKISSTYSYDDKRSVYSNVLGYDKIIAYNYSTMDDNTASKNNLLTKNQTNTLVSGSVSKYKNVNTITYSKSGYPTQIMTKQFNGNNQQTDSYSISYEYNK